MEELTAYFAEFGNQFALPIAAVSKHHLDTFAIKETYFEPGVPYDIYYSETKRRSE
jgi:siderophore synthetase component